MENIERKRSGSLPLPNAIYLNHDNLPLPIQLNRKEFSDSELNISSSESTVSDSSQSSESISELSSSEANSPVPERDDDEFAITVKNINSERKRHQLKTISRSLDIPDLTRLHSPLSFTESSPVRNTLRVEAIRRSSIPLPKIVLSAFEDNDLHTGWREYHNTLTCIYFNRLYNEIPIRSMKHVKINQSSNI